MLFKSVNHFPQTVDAFDHLFNDAIDIHVEAVDHDKNISGGGIRAPSRKSSQPRF
jgi:hypothetical protein